MEVKNISQILGRFFVFHVVLREKGLFEKEREVEKPT